MKKIVSIQDNIVYIGNEDGSLQQVRKEDCSFEPTIGDSVNIFSNETKTIVTKIDEESKPTESTPEKERVDTVDKSNLPQTSQTSPTEGKVVNKVTYCLLAFFFGGIGVHKFYAGKIGMGIFYLIFCWTGIPCLIGIIECFITLAKPNDSQGNIII